MISPADLIFFFFLEQEKLWFSFLRGLPNISFNVPHKKVSHMGLERHEGQ